MSTVNESFPVKSTRRCEMIEITSQIADIVSRSGIGNGTCTVYCGHTTAAVTVNENADPSVTHDILITLGELIPKNHRSYQHAEGNSDAHVKSSLVGCSEHVLVKNGNLLLGTWQGIYFCEFDGPRNRNVSVQIRS